MSYCMSKAAIDQFTRCTALGKSLQNFHIKHIAQNQSDEFGKIVLCKCIVGEVLEEEMFIWTLSNIL